MENIAGFLYYASSAALGLTPSSVRTQVSVSSCTALRKCSSLSPTNVPACACHSISDWIAQRRIYALVEMAFLIYRTLLPMPAWLDYYGQEGQYFAVLYMILKVNGWLCSQSRAWWSRLQSCTRYCRTHTPPAKACPLGLAVWVLLYFY